MNERQAKAQETLSKGESQGTDSVSVNTPINTSNDSQLSKSTFFKVLLIASVLDLFSFLLNLIPFVGGIFADVIIWLPGTVILFIIYLRMGVKFNNKNSLKIAGCSLIEIIPVLNALPGFIASVVLTLGPMIAKDLIGEIPGGEQINEVQKSLSSIKK